MDQTPPSDIVHIRAGPVEITAKSPGIMRNVSSGLAKQETPSLPKMTDEPATSTISTTSMTSSSSSPTTSTAEVISTKKTTSISSGMPLESDVMACPLRKSTKAPLETDSYKERTTQVVRAGLVPEAWVLIGIVFIILILTIFIVYRGLYTDWFASFHASFNWVPFLVLWIFAYLLMLLGVMMIFGLYPKYNNRGTIVMFGCLIGIGILLGLAWTTSLLFAKDVYLAFFIQTITVLYYLYFFYIMFRYGELCCLLMTPLLFLSIYVFVQGTTMMFANPSDMTTWEYLRKIIGYRR